MEMDFDTTLKKIKTRGYWVVNFFPVAVDSSLISSPRDCKEIVRSNSVSLRGWDYPHVPTSNDEKQGLYIAGNDRAESWIDWEQFKEIWRLYTNGQFINLLGIRNDWFDEDTWHGKDEFIQSIKPNTSLDLIEVIYFVTEIFQFLKKLVDAGVYKSTIKVKVKLVNTKNRKLILTDRRRVGLWGDYSCHTDTVHTQELVLSPEDITSNAPKLAMNTIKEILDQFQWENPIAQFEQDQTNFLNRKLY